MGVRHVDDAHRRRLLVARQCLGDPGRSARSLDEAVSALGLVHSTDPSTPYLSIHARSDAPMSAIDSAFFDERSLLRHTTIRRTVFATPLDVVPLAHGAVNGPLVAKLREQLVKWIDASPDASDRADRFLDRTEAAVIDHIRNNGPATGVALSKAVPDLQVRFDPMPGKDYSKPQRITSKVLEILAADGRLARGRPTGTDFTSAAWTWALIEDWLGASGIAPLAPADALAGLIARHLASFGPATVTDLAWWAGVPKGKITTALAAVGAIEVSLDDVGEAGYVTSDDDLATSDTNGSVALLPGLDSTTMGWKQRAWYVDDRVGTGLFDRNGNAGPTVWLDGRVVGAWTQRPDGEVATKLLSDIGSEHRAQLDAEIERLTQFLGAVRVKWRFPTPLSKQLSAG